MTAPRVGLGCLRLPPADAGRAVVVAAFAAGVRLFDTARAYGNEALLVGLAAEIVSKVGMARPGGGWLPDGRAQAIRAGAEETARALGRPPEVLLLHAPDPRVPLATSVRALAAARAAGLCGAIGVCNVNRTQLESALAVADIAVVQVGLGFGDESALADGLVGFCLACGIRVLAHTPLGGPKRAAALARDAELAAIAARHRATPAEVVLARLLAAGVSPVAGATRPESARSIAAAERIVLADDERWRPRIASPVGAARGEVVLVIGSPGAGKSTLAAGLAARGHERLNRDESGGTLAALAGVLDGRAAAGATRFVLDNTYATRKARRAVVDVAARHGLAVRCLWLDTSLDDAQVNVCQRLCTQHGRLPGPDELDPPPRALFRYRDAFEPPAGDEGFAAVERVPFVRRPPAGTARGLLVDLDHALWRSASGARAPVAPDDVEVIPAALAFVSARRADGWIVAGVTWQPGIDPAITAACIARLEMRTGFAFPVESCTHPAGPPRCWCRKPLPGLGVVLIERLGLDPSRSQHLGGKPADELFARRLGMASVSV